MSRRSSFTLSVLVLTTASGIGGVVHEATVIVRPFDSTSTIHVRHEPTGFIFG